jgi:SAM-dependent methyltransferase
MNRIERSLHLIKRFFLFLYRWDWYIFKFRLRAIVYRVDLTTMYQHELGLPPETVFCSSSSGGASLAYALRHLSITGMDRCLDVGCGKGGALITLSDFPFGRVAGLELSDTLIEIARENLHRLGRKDIALFCCNALEFPGYDDYNYIYLYNPFPLAVMKPFLQSLAASLLRAPRTLTVIYKNPTCHDEVVGSGIFDFVEQIQEYNDHPYNIYRSKVVLQGAQPAQQVA